MTGPRGFGLEWGEAEIDLAAWQGITALRFDPAPPPGLVAVLVVDLARPASGLTAADVAVDAPDGSALHALVDQVTDGDTSLRAGFPDRGPRGHSVVRLTSGGADPLHPFFDRATFDFHIDCPAGDCRAVAGAERTAPGPEPAVDLVTKDFDGFVRVAQDWALATDPNWSDLDPASTEQLLLELVAHHADLLSLHQDRVVQEAFVDTARQRSSVRRHAAFLGLPLDEGASASAVVALDVGAGRSGYLPAGTRVVRREDRGRVTATFVTAAPALLDARWNAGLADRADRGDLVPAAWPGAPDAVVPAGATSLLLLGWNSGLLAGQQVALVQGTDAHVGTLVGVEEFEAPGWTDEPTALPGTAIRQVTLLAWDAPTTVSFAPWADPGRPLLVTANLVPATHGDPRRAVNRPADGSIPLGATRRDAVLATDVPTGQVQLRALRTPESGVLVEDGTRPALALAIGGEEWHWQPDLWTSAGFDPHYSTERDEDGSVWLLFGDGRRGRAVPVPPGTAPAAGLGFDPADPAGLIELAYRRGRAEDGNLGAFALNATLPPVGGDASAEAGYAALGVRAATNLLPAAGGRSAVPLETARQLVPESIRHPALERCVTPADYARAAEDVPGVAHAAARPLGGIFNTIVVLCAPAETDELGEDLRARVHGHLDRLRMAGREHVVRQPDYVPLDIAVLVCPADRRTGPAELRAGIRAALAPGTAAAPGFFHRSRTGFGAEIQLADVLAACSDVPGAGPVRALFFAPLFDAGEVRVRRSIRLTPTEIAQFRADESRPEQGRLRVLVQGVDPVEAPDAFRIGGPVPEPGQGGVP
ncbi:hypothetical protein SAMN04515665_103139 [Blastococcus sp. DSM 46786]|uniref:hypothetical protein n=1 Tax=Blastococcus sp. DSM 46786 TaxID=1798227 RepID=UPI0008C5D273|nr:hypothetical protein [Blastococcus sp. DSM 46786]SEK59781.1 hypothetical protein SAMN04515665_103139 [Blastococcus sp. DSM 46786]